MHKEPGATTPGATTHVISGSGKYEKFPINSKVTPPSSERASSCKPSLRAADMFVACSSVPLLASGGEMQVAKLPLAERVAATRVTPKRQLAVVPSCGGEGRSDSFEQSKHCGFQSWQRAAVQATWLSSPIPSS